ncbi:hypothetical protein [Burkholderia gladioli]|uniref:hypothetical protein n=1 Tax=Burkholderia gladioli TaxID=28095 RepID=UPI00163FECB9|nr:hypothetical protein [Burkholderia gladioli]
MSTPPDSAAGERAALDAVAPLVNAWLIQRGTSMDGASYVAALQLAAHVARSITTTPANRAAAAARDTLEALGYTYLDGAMHWKPPRGRRPAWLDDDAAPRRYPATLTPELQHVLGRPNFWCAQYARVMRAAGVEIECRAETEQAYVLHWLVKLVLDHGENWAIAAGAQIGDMQAIARAAPSTNGSES